MIYSVNQGHIEAGKQGDCGLCPVALAIRDVHPDADVWVGDYRLSIGDGSWINSPPEVTQFIRIFDTGILPVEPFEFTL